MNSQKHNLQKIYPQKHRFVKLIFRDKKEYKAVSYYATLETKTLESLKDSL